MKTQKEGLALGWIYTLYGGLVWMQAVFFYGVGASVIGIIALSAYKLSAKTIGRDGLLWAIFQVTLLVTIVTQTEQVLLFLAAGILVWLVKAPPKLRWYFRGDRSRNRGNYWSGRGPGSAYHH